MVPENWTGCYGVKYMEYDQEKLCCEHRKCEDELCLSGRYNRGNQTLLPYITAAQLHDALSYFYDHKEEIEAGIQADHHAIKEHELSFFAISIFLRFFVNGTLNTCPKIPDHDRSIAFKFFIVLIRFGLGLFFYMLPVRI